MKPPLQVWTRAVTNTICPQPPTGTVMGGSTALTKCYPNNYAALIIGTCELARHDCHFKSGQHCYLFDSSFAPRRRQWQSGSCFLTIFFSSLLQNSLLRKKPTILTFYSPPKLQILLPRQRRSFPRDASERTVLRKHWRL